MPTKTEERQAAVDILEDHELEGLIKRELKISFNRDETRWADKFERDLAQRKRAVRCSRTMKVEPSTLKATMRRRLEAGEEVDYDLFNIHIQRVAKVDSKKA